MPFHGDIRSAPVPGCVDGWLALHERFGRLPLAEVLDAAIGVRRRRVPRRRRCWPCVQPLLGAWPAPTTSSRGSRCAPGDVVRRPGVARALRGDRRPAAAAGFYEGEFGDGLLRLGGGEYTADDLARPLADWVEPLGADAWGHALWTIPPTSPGLPHPARRRASPRGLPLPDDPDDPAWAHLLVEAARAAGPRPPGGAARGRRRRAACSSRRGRPAPSPRRSRPPQRCAADRRPPAAARCTSAPPTATASACRSSSRTPAGFGCLVFEPATGIGLHNRGIGFSSSPATPPSTDPAGGRRTRCRRRWSPIPTARCGPSSARWAATASRRSSCSCCAGSCATAQSPGRAISARRGGSSQGTHRLRHVDGTRRAPRCSSRRTRPPGGPTGSSSGATRSSSPGPRRPRLRPRPPDRGGDDSAHGWAGPPTPEPRSAPPPATDR